MKNLLLAALGIFLMTAILDSCKDNTSSLLMPTKQTPPPPPPAHPAVVYNGPGGISVMDTDGTHQTVVRGNGSDGGWSPTGGSVLIANSAGSIDSLNALDISVNGSGVPVGSNYRNITTHNNSDTTVLSAYSWSSTTSVNQIGFAISPGQRTGVPGTFKTTIYLVSASGGAWTTLHTFGNGGRTKVSSLVWSPDDSKIAALIDSFGVWRSVVILNASTGAVTDSIPLSGATGVSWKVLDWSRTGSLNKLLLDNIYEGHLYYVSPSTGSTPTTNNVVTDGNGTFSPNNSGVMYTNTTYSTDKHGVTTGTVSLDKNVTQTSTTSTILSNLSSGQSGFGIFNLHWKR